VSQGDGDCGLGAGRGERGRGIAAMSGGAVVDALVALEIIKIAKIKK
jgi:hypothetical protein